MAVGRLTNVGDVVGRRVTRSATCRSRVESWERRETLEPSSKSRAVENPSRKSLSRYKELPRVSRDKESGASEVERSRYLADAVRNRQAVKQPHEILNITSRNA